jgi:hypothetical protein
MNRQLYNKAMLLGASDFGFRNNKFFVVYEGKTINFNVRGYMDLPKHKQMRYWSRYCKIKDELGRKVINDKRSPIYWKVRLLLDT